MRFIGRMATVALLGLAAVATLVGVRSIPDVKRYLRIRSM